MARFMRATVIGAALLSGTLLVAPRCSLLARDGEALRIGLRKQLFVDDHLIAARRGVVRKLGRAVKANDGRPVIVDDRPWEEFGTPILGSVLRDGGKFRMWYRGAGGGPDGGVWCYAESVDGLRWTKPDLGLVMFRGSRDNNIYVIGQPQAYTPFIDPNEVDPDRRYKSAVGTKRIDTALAFSADGLRWTSLRGGRAITGRASDTISQLLWDPFARVYRLYTRTDFGSGGGAGEVRGTRDMIAAVDSDLSDPGSWRTVRAWCLGWERGDLQYHDKRQIYSLNGWIHEGVQFGLLWALERPGGDELMETFLATTRGDRPWKLDWVYSDQTFLERGKEGSFDCRWIQASPGILTFEDRHWIYYVGLAKTHGGRWAPDIRGPRGGIGLATLRLDGFVSLEAGDEAGTVTTKPFHLEGDTVAVNVEAPRGEVAVEVLDGGGEPIAGYSEADAVPGRAIDDLRWRPRWKDREDLAPLENRVVRFRFRLRQARIYSFQVVKEETLSIDLSPPAAGFPVPKPRHVMVCEDAGAGGYEAFPDVCRLVDGRLMCAFYGGYGHVALPNERQPKGGRVSYSTSRDEGRTWSAPRVLFDGPHDDRDPSIVQLEDGRLLCNFFSLRRKETGGYRFAGTFLVTSRDGGQTWSRPETISETFATSSPIRVLSDGRLVLGLYSERNGVARGAVTLSDDGGKTWSAPIDIDNAGAYLDAETDIVELRDGRLYAAQRGGKGAQMHWSVSRDRGVTWTVSRPIGFAAHCPYLHRSPDGILLIAHRIPSTSLHYSLDEGRTWSRSLLVDETGGAYPSMVNLRDGTILIVYYEEGAGSNIRAKRFRATRSGVEWLRLD